MPFIYPWNRNISLGLKPMSCSDCLAWLLNGMGPQTQENFPCSGARCSARILIKRSLFTRPCSYPDLSSCDRTWWTLSTSHWKQNGNKNSFEVLRSVSEILAGILNMDFIAEHSYRKMTLEEAFQACLKSSLLKTIKRKSDPCYHGSTADQGFQLWLVNDVPFCLVEVNQVYPVRGWRRFSVHAQVWSLTKSNLYFLYFFIWKNNGCFKLFYGHQKQK